MKKLYFICMVLFISLSTTMWTACSDDDDDPDPKDPTEGVEPTDSTSIVAPAYDTTFLTKVVCENAMNPGLGYADTYTFTWDENHEQITSIHGEINMQGEEQSIDYTITYTDTEVRVVYMDE